MFTLARGLRGVLDAARYAGAKRWRWGHPAMAKWHARALRLPGKLSSHGLFAVWHVLPRIAFYCRRTGILRRVPPSANINRVMNRQCEFGKERSPARFELTLGCFNFTRSPCANCKASPQADRIARKGTA